MLANVVHADTRQIMALPRQMFMTQVRPTVHKKPEKVTAAEIAYGLTLPFRPGLTDAMMRLDRFEDLPVDRVKALIRALIIDVDGTLIRQGTELFPHEVIKKILEIREQMPVCIFPDDQERIPAFEQLGIPVVRNVPPKTDPRSFDVAVQLYLQNLHHSTRMLYPGQCAMVGDNFLTDGACRKIGMQLIHVKPLIGRESVFRVMTRNLADGIAKIHDRFR